MTHNTSRSLYILCTTAVCLWASFVYTVFASETNGTIDATNKYSTVCYDTTCTTYGTVNWKPTLNAVTPGASAVAITDTGLSGHLWGDGIGWVNLGPTGSGVTINPTTGVLSGKAFANVGSWINFSPTTVSGGTTVGVTINSAGQFVGWAYVSGIQGGWMKFDCSGVGTCVQTDWRPVPHRTTTGGGSGGGGGGGIPGTLDICPNLLGTQIAVPSGYVLVQGVCVPNTANVPSVNPQTPTPPSSLQPNVPIPQQPTPTPVRTGTQIAPTPGTQPIDIPVPNQSNFTPSFTRTPSSTVDPFEGLGFTRREVAERTPDPFVPSRTGGYIEGDLYVATYNGYLNFNPLRAPLPLATGATLIGYSEVPQSSTARVELRPRAGRQGVQNITTQITHIAPLPPERYQLVVPVEYSWFLRIIRMLVSSVTPQVAYADTLDVVQKAVDLPEATGVYTLAADVTYQDGTREQVSRPVVVLQRGSLYTRYAGLFSFESPVVGVVSAYRMNEDAGEYEAWDATLYDQPNPQWTDTRGTYSIVVPEGIYQVKYAAHGFADRTISGTVVAGRDSQVLNDKVELICSATGQWKCLWDIKIIAFLLLVAAIWHRRRRARGA